MRALFTCSHFKKREEMWRRWQDTRKKFLNLLEQSNISKIVNNYSKAEEHFGKDNRY